MKKKRINLIINRANYNLYQSYLNLIKIILYIFSFIIFIILISKLIILRNQISIFNKLNSQKTKLLQLLNEKNTEEIKIKFLEKKYQLLKEFLKDDSFSSPYYQLLLENLSLASSEPKLKVFRIDKNQNTEFTILFNNFSDLKDFFKFAESDTFIDNFEKLSLKSFNINNETKEKEDYELSFTGKFKNINQL